MKKGTKLPLNSLEKFMLAHESDAVSYNSQFIIEFDGILDPKDFREVIRKAVNDIPWLRTKTTQGIFNFNRTILNPEDINLDLTLEVSDTKISQDKLDKFCATKFDLEKGHTFSFLLSPLSNLRSQLVFNAHHSLCDGAGQVLFLEEFFRILNKKEVRPEASKIDTFRYRNLFKIMGAKWFLTNLWNNRKPLKKQRKYLMAGLVDHPESTGRTVTSTTFNLDHEQQKIIRETCKEHQITATALMTFMAFRAYDKTLLERGDHKTPIMAYVPKTLRPFLKIRYTFQNILSTVYIVGKRQEIHDLKFLGKVNHLIQIHKMDQAAKFIFSTLIPGAMTTTKKLKHIFTSMDNDTESLTASMLVSAGKVSRSYEFPQYWFNINIWARGTMLRSPGIGVIMTGTSESESITLECVKELTDRSTLELLKKNLIEILDEKKDKLDQNFIPVTGQTNSSNLFL